MVNKTIGMILLAAGVLLLLVTPTADITGLGHTPGFGWVQLSGTVAGVAAVVLGFVIRRQSN